MIWYIISLSYIILYCIIFYCITWYSIICFNPKPLKKVVQRLSSFGGTRPIFMGSEPPVLGNLTWIAELSPEVFPRVEGTHHDVEVSRGGWGHGTPVPKGGTTRWTCESDTAPRNWMSNKNMGMSNVPESFTFCWNMLKHTAICSLCIILCWFVDICLFASPCFYVYSFPFLKLFFVDYTWYFLIGQLQLWLRPSFFLLADDSLASLGEKDDDEEEAPERMTTPPKINIELENDGLEDVFPFPGVYSQVPC